MVNRYTQVQPLSEQCSSATSRWCHIDLCKVGICKNSVHLKCMIIDRDIVIMWACLWDGLHIFVDLYLVLRGWSTKSTLPKNPWFNHTMVNHVILWTFFLIGYCGLLTSCKWTFCFRYKMKTKSEVDYWWLRCPLDLMTDTVLFKQYKVY